MGKAVREMDRMLKALKKENKEQQMALEESEPEYSTEKDSDSDEFEDWEDEPRKQTRRVRIRSSTPIPVNRTTPRYLRFNASKESREEQVDLQSKLLELNITEAVRQQVGGRKQGEDLSVYANHIMKAAEAARLGKDSITRCSAHLYRPCCLCGGIREGTKMDRDRGSI